MTTSRVRGSIALALTLTLLLAVFGMVMWIERPQLSKPAEGAPRSTVSWLAPSGRRTYDNADLGFRLSFPGSWKVTEGSVSSQPEGAYFMLTLEPRPAAGVAAITLNVVPDPQGFSAGQVYAAKWSRVATDTTIVATGAVPAGGAVEVRSDVRSAGGAPVHRYEAISTRPGRLYLLDFETKDGAVVAGTQAEARRILGSLTTY